MTNSADPDQLPSSEVNLSRSTLFAKEKAYWGSAGPGLILLFKGNVCAGKPLCDSVAQLH